MEFKDIVVKRRSTRKFSPRKVEREVVKSILESVYLAPSSRNSHSTSYIVVENEELLLQISQMRDYGSSFVKDAPAAIVVMGDTSKTDLAEVNCSIAATMLQLAIVDAGLASCWVHVAGRPQKQAEPAGKLAQDLLRSILPIPEECEVLCVIAFGYSQFEPAPLPEFDGASMVRYID